MEFIVHFFKKQSQNKRALESFKNAKVYPIIYLKDCMTKCAQTLRKYNTERFKSFYKVSCQ